MDLLPLKLYMHCDRVYAILTRGPFPSGEVTDVAVEIHLAHCLDCRRLAEALRPLDRPSHEPMSVEIARLPGYRGDHPEWNPNSPQTSMAEHLAIAPLRVHRRRPPRPAAQFHFGRLIASVLFGVAIGAILTSINSPGAFADRGTIVSASFAGERNGDWAEAQVQAHLIYGLNLPRACSKLDAVFFYPLSSDERSTRLTRKPPSFVNQCCTQCHVAGGRTQVGQAQRGKLVASCTICHSNSPRARW